MKKFIATLAVLSPLTVFASQPITDINSAAQKFTGIANLIVGLLITLAVVWIIWNVVFFIIKASDPVARKQYGVGILWGIVGLFVILSIWGLVNILSGTFTTQNNVPTNQIPQISPNIPVVQ